MSNTSIFVRQSEHDLEEKIRGLESNMMFLMNRLKEEKQKLSDVLACEIKSDKAATTPLPLLDAANQDPHEPECPMSRLVLEIDPNCKVHGHLYRKHNIHTIEPQFLQPGAVDGYSTETSDMAGGDIQNQRVHSKKTQPEDYNITDVHAVDSLKSFYKYNNLPIFQTKETIENRNDDLSEFSFEGNADSYGDSDGSSPLFSYGVDEQQTSSTDVMNGYNSNTQVPNDPTTMNPAEYVNNFTTNNTDMENKRQLAADTLEALKKSYYHSFMEELPLDLLKDLLNSYQLGTSD